MIAKMFVNKQVFPRTARQTSDMLLAYLLIFLSSKGSFNRSEASLGLLLLVSGSFSALTPVF